jgi:hypothetical protein
MPTALKAAEGHVSLLCLADFVRLNDSMLATVLEFDDSPVIDSATEGRTHWTMVDYISLKKLASLLVHLSRVDDSMRRRVMQEFIQLHSQD